MEYYTNQQRYALLNDLGLSSMPELISPLPLARPDSPVLQASEKILHDFINKGTGSDPLKEFREGWPE